MLSKFRQTTVRGYVVRVCHTGWPWNFSTSDATYTLPHHVTYVSTIISNEVQEEWHYTPPRTTQRQAL